MAMGIFCLLVIYTTVYNSAFNLPAFSQALAGTAAVLIGLSFAMSGFVYYFDFLDTRLAYRKYLGLTGFWLALGYSLSLCLTNPDRYFFHFFEYANTADVRLGLLAMAIYTFMALISNNRAIKKLGPRTWRYCLRLGYLAYALLIIRAYIMEQDLWTGWWQSPQGSLPPPRLIITLFALAVILFRGSMIVVQFARKHLLPGNPPLQK